MIGRYLEPWENPAASAWPEMLTWAEPANEADVSRVTFEIEAVDDTVRLDVIHGDFTPGSDMVNRVSGGWPRVLSNLKSFLETGKGII